MSKLEWGLKRVCPSCTTRFYDLRKNPILCPKCGTIYDPEALVKPRRGRLSNEEKKARLALDDATPTELLLAETVIEEVDLEGDVLIEDTSELDTEADDVLDVEVDETGDDKE